MKKIIFPVLIMLLGCSNPTPLPQPPDSPNDDSIYDVDFSTIRIKFQPSGEPYPTEAKAKGVEGNVTVMITINKDGIPTQSHAIDGHELLRKPSEIYALKWMFKPTIINKHPRNVRFKILFPFRLR